MEIYFEDEYLQYCVENKDEIIKIWQEEDLPVLWQYKTVPLFSYQQLLKILERVPSIRFDFTRGERLRCNVFGNNNQDFQVTTEAFNYSECILRMLIELRKDYLKKMKEI